MEPDLPTNHEGCEEREPDSQGEDGRGVATAVAALLALDDGATPDELRDALSDVARLAQALDGLEREIVRETAIKELRRRGASSPARLVDAALGSSASGERDPSVGGSTPFMCDPEPWPLAVDGAELLSELCATLRRFVIMPEGAYEAVALWCLYTHCFDAFDVAPLLLFTSATKRCGKTRAKEIASRLVARPLQVTNITAAALFRGVEKYQPTLLIDEADRFLKDNPELNGIVNGAHTRDSAFVLRCVGDECEPRLFSTWCPKLIAGIGRQLGTLEDRAIIVELRRRAAGEPVEPWHLHRANELEPLQRRCARWAADHSPELRAAEPDLPDLDGNDRAADNWRPLLAIADAAGGVWPQLARAAARRLAGAVSDDGDGIGVTLLGDLRLLFDERDAALLPTSEILDALQAMEERPWGDFRHGRPLSAENLARLLRPFGVRPHKQRVVQAPNPVSCYRREDFEDAFARWAPARPGTDGTCLQNETFSLRTDKPGVPPQKVAICGAVPVVSGDAPGARSGRGTHSPWSADL